MPGNKYFSTFGQLWVNHSPPHHHFQKLCRSTSLTFPSQTIGEKADREFCRHISPLRYAPLYVYLLGTFFVTKHPSKGFDPWEVKKQVCHKPLRQSAFIFGTYIAAGAAKEKQWQSEVLFFSKDFFRELLSSSFSSHPLELTTRTLNTSCSSSNLFRSPLPPSPRWPPAISSATHYIDLPPHPPTAIALPFHTILFYVSGAQSATTAVPFISTESAVRRPMTYAYATPPPL